MQFFLGTLCGAALTIFIMSLMIISGTESKRERQQEYTKNTKDSD